MNSPSRPEPALPVSVLINNYNYGHFLRRAIESALNQTYPSVEVIVVDDGSTDDSPAIIASYGDRIVPVLKENEGQASAFNAGVAASHGEIICFLDADDMFCRSKVSETVTFVLSRLSATKDIFVSHAIDYIDADDHPVRVSPGRRYRRHPINLYAYARRHRYIPFVSSPTSGFAMTRSLAARIFPLPIEGTAVSADDLVVRAAALLGEVYSLDRVLTHYRLHGTNRWYGHRRLKSRAFHEIEDAFLNARLVASGREPVISFFDSWFARDHYLYERSRTGLVRLALSVLHRCPNLQGLAFALKTVLLAIILPMSGPHQERSER